jgi:hypothetical protein
VRVGFCYYSSDTCLLFALDLADNLFSFVLIFQMNMYLGDPFFGLCLQVLHATVIKQMQMVETLEAVKESDLRVSIT